jgi:hypothetical protein
MWTKEPSKNKAVEATALWNVLEDGGTKFMNWVWDRSWSWTDTDTVFDKFKYWLLNVYRTTTLVEKNAIYSGLVSEVADLEFGATLAQLGKNFDEGKEVVGAEKIIPNGYSSVPDRLVALISAFPNCNIQLNSNVVKIATVVDETSESRRRLTVTLDNDATYTATRVIVTVPLGVLKTGTIKFEPELSAAKKTAIAKIGVGLLDRITLLYNKNFWKDDVNEMGTATWFAVFDPKANPVGLTPPKPRYGFFNTAKYYDKPLVTMLIGAETAEEYETWSDNALVNASDTLFRSLWTGTTNAVVDSYLISRWRADKYARGSYTYLPPGATVNMRTTLCAHVGDGIFWAGEHCSIDYPSTVNGAFDSGLSASKMILATQPTQRPTTRRPPTLRPTTRRPSTPRPTKKPTRRPSL